MPGVRGDQNAHQAACRLGDGHILRDDGFPGFSPVDQLELARARLADSGAAFDPVAGVDVVYAVHPTRRRVVDVAADDAIDIVPPRFLGQSVLEFADEVDCTP